MGESGPAAAAATTKTLTTKSPSPTLKSPSLKDKAPPRPILKRKGTPGRSNKGSFSSSSSVAGSARLAQQEVVQDSGTEPVMAASFLQFCAMCEKQIMNPSNSILYCSEACRRKDSVKPLSAAIIITTPTISTTTTPPPSSPLSSPRPHPLLSPRTLTGVSTSSDRSRSPIVSSIPADLHDHTSDLDPTEWKPKLPHRNHSDAFHYLSRFHRSVNATEGVGGGVVIGQGGGRLGKPDYHIAASVPTPSLGNTPTTVSGASSLSTSVGLGLVSRPSQHQYSNSLNGYDFNTRPLPLRPNRWYSFNNGTPKGVDLVTPHVADPVSSTASSVSAAEMTYAVDLRAVKIPITNDDGGMKWEKRKVMFATPSRGDDGLSVLFADRA